MEEFDARVSLIDETLNSGLDPIELLATPIRSPLTDLPVAYRTHLRINSVEVGVIQPEQYDPVASRTSQCVSLALWNFRRVCDLAKDLREISSAIGFFTVRTPSRILTKGKIGDLVETVLKEAGYDDPSNVCFEFPRESVFSDTEAMANGLRVLKSYGIKSALVGYGDEFCPAPRLASLPFDYVMLDESVLADLMNPEKELSVEALIKYVSTFGAEYIALGRTTAEESERLVRIRAFGYEDKDPTAITESELRAKF